MVSLMSKNQSLQKSFVKDNRLVDQKSLRSDDQRSPREHTVIRKKMAVKAKDRQTYENCLSEEIKSKDIKNDEKIYFKQQ